MCCRRGERPRKKVGRGSEDNNGVPKGPRRKTADRAAIVSTFVFSACLFGVPPLLTRELTKREGQLGFGY